MGLPNSANIEHSLIVFVVVIFGDLENGQKFTLKGQNWGNLNELIF